MFRMSCRSAVIIDAAITGKLRNYIPCKSPHKLLFHNLKPGLKHIWCFGNCYYLIHTIIFSKLFNTYGKPLCRQCQKCLISSVLNHRKICNCTVVHHRAEGHYLTSHHHAGYSVIRCAGSHSSLQRMKSTIAHKLLCNFNYTKKNIWGGGWVTN